MSMHSMDSLSMSIQIVHYFILPVVALQGNQTLPSEFPYRLKLITGISADVLLIKMELPKADNPRTINMGLGLESQKTGVEFFL